MDRLTPAPSSSPLLSLAMIVRDEAQTLERCLSQAREFVDEIAVVDTGSTDESPTIARSYADVFERIEWPDSFAEARNYSYDLASGRYIMWLDADEYIPEEGDWKRIRRALRENRPALVRLRVRNILPAQSLIDAHEIWQTRITRNEPEIRWEGAIHNQIAPNAESFARSNGLATMRLDAQVVHTGYALDEEQKKDKYRSRLQLLERTYSRSTSSTKRAYYGFQLGLVYYVLNRYEATWRIFHEIDFGALSQANRFHASLLSARTALASPVIPAELAYEHCQAMLELAPSEAVGYFILAVVLMEEGHYDQGASVLADSYLKHREHGSDSRFQLDTEYIRDRLAELVQTAPLTGVLRDRIADLLSRSDVPSENSLMDPVERPSSVSSSS